MAHYFSGCFAFTEKSLYFKQYLNEVSVVFGTSLVRLLSIFLTSFVQFSYKTEVLVWLRIASGEEISPLLLGNDFMMSKTGEYWTFSENNVLYDTYCNENPLMNQYASWGYGNFQPTWHVQDDKLVVTGLNGDGKEVETAFTIYEVGNGIFLLYTDSTEMLVGDLMYGDGTGVYSLYKKSAVEDRFLIP